MVIITAFQSLTRIGDCVIFWAPILWQM